MRIVMVEWQDPAYTSSHWEDREPFIEEPVSCITCGILLHADKKNVHIVLNLNPQYYSQGIVIPRGMIKRMRTLKVKE